MGDWEDGITLREMMRLLDYKVGFKWESQLIKFRIGWVQGERGLSYLRYFKLLSENKSLEHSNSMMLSTIFWLYFSFKKLVNNYPKQVILKGQMDFFNLVLMVIDIIGLHSDTQNITENYTMFFLMAS